MCQGRTNFWPLILYQIIRKKLVPKFQNKSKNTFEPNKRNSPITSTFGPTKTYIILHRNSKVWKYCIYASSRSLLIFFLLIFQISTVQWLNCRNLKDKKNYFCNGGGDAYLLKIWSDFSSIQYTIYCKAEKQFAGGMYLLHQYKSNFDQILHY